MSGRATGDDGKRNQTMRMLTVVHSNSSIKNLYQQIGFNGSAMLQVLISVFFATEMVARLTVK
jgi:hypothetical protein